MRREEIVPKLCKSKKILDIGGAGTSDNPGWLHKEIAKKAEVIVGIDNWEEGVEIMNDQGFNFHLADASNFNLDEKFDLVVACEAVEHIAGIGNLLENVRAHLKEEGKFVMTTPNPHSMKKIFWNLREGNATTQKEEEAVDLHVHYFFPRDFRRLSRRHGFEHKKTIWLMDEVRDIPTFKGKILMFLFSWLPQRIRANNWLGIFEVIHNDER